MFLLLTARFVLWELSLSSVCDVWWARADDANAPGAGTTSAKSSLPSDASPGSESEQRRPHPYSYTVLEGRQGSSEVIITAHGNFLSPRIDGAVAMYLKKYGEFEHPKIRFVLALADMVKPSESPIYLDIGANIGVWTVAMARHRGGVARVHAFEAVLETYYYLGANVVLNGLGNVMTHYGVVAEKPGAANIIKLNLASDLGALNIGSASVHFGEHAHRELRDAYETRPTKAFTLDSMFESGEIAACPTFIKMDIEAYEILAVRGATRLMTECHPVLVLEFICTELNKSMMTLLDSLGYAMAWLISPFIENPRIYQDYPVDFIYGDVNVVAVPKSYADVLYDLDFAGTLLPIDLSKPGYDVLNATVCSDTKCFPITQNSASNTWLCGALPQAHVDFHMKLTEHIRR